MKLALVTAGPTYEPIDPVRFIGNRSSGKMGYAIAEALAEKGYQVKLVSGPVAISAVHPSIEVIKVETAAEMYAATMQYADDYDIAFCAAAVADFTPINKADQKIKKQAGQDEMVIRLTKTQDILATLGAQKSDKQTLVGFSLETNNAIENAKSKLARKDADYIILNTLEENGAGFGYDTNKVYLINKKQEIMPFPLQSKVELARELVERIIG